MSEIKETNTVIFKKQPQPDLAAVYSAEKVEAIPYVTIWEGGVTEDKCDFLTSEDVFRTADKFAEVRDALIEFQTRGKPYRDYPKARVISVEATPEGHLSLTFSKVKSSDYLITNYAVEIQPAGWSGTIRDILEPGPALTPLKKSLCSNHLGLSCLVITKDEKIILNRGTQQKITSPGQISSSASGAMDWKNPFITPFECMQAELFEEIGLESSETAEIKAIAIARELARGGKPEMFFLLETNLTSGEILSRDRSDPDKEVERVFTVDLPEDKDNYAKLKELWESPDTAQSTKAALYYLSRRLKK